MKKVLALMLCGLLLLQGCGKKTQETSNNMSPEGTETPAPTETPTEEPTSEPDQEMEEPEEEVSITLPEQNLMADYTKADGIQLPPGSQIAVVVKDKETGFWKAVKEGMELAVEDINEACGYTGKDKVKLTFESPSDSNDIDTQINIIDAVLAENPLVLCLSPIDMGSCHAQLESAEENGIPVILVDGGVKGAEANPICSTDHYAVGQEAAIHLSQAMGDMGQAAIVGHQPLTESCVERENGFRTEIEQNHPGIQILPETVYDDGKASLEEQVEQLLESNLELKGIFCTNEKTGEAVLNVLEKMEDRQISVVTVDAGSDIIEAIEEGRDVGTVCQNPYGMGYASVIAGARAAMDLPNDSYINPGYQWIDAENLDLPENQKYLYE